ncbi:MAG TPA: TauD/TfdA family dioxygenase [Pyrinomonadaceae bacterium]|nr:TauD/TfdA family dioxygenase [Pyrinomonadaceae bacterium]
MNADELQTMKLGASAPFGVTLTSVESGRDLRSLGADYLKALVEENRVAILRGFAPLRGDDFPDFCRDLGELQEWDFGVVNNLRVDARAENYLYTNRAVPFHWDGAFAGRIPHYIIFHCDAAPADGSGQTLLTDTVRLLAAVSAGTLQTWRQVDITYTTEKVVHYGGSFNSPLITRHPVSGREVLRFAEPVFDLNPVRLEIHGLANLSEADFLTDLGERLRDPASCYEHQWRAGDVVIADNYVLLHGRREFAEANQRHIRRVNVF